MLDRPVLAGGVHRLEDQEHRVGVLRVEHVLLFGELPHAGSELFARLLLPEPGRPVGLEILQPDAAARTGDDPVDQFASPFHVCLTCSRSAEARELRPVV